MIGSIASDIIGSIYKIKNVKHKNKVGTRQPEAWGNAL